MVSALMVILIGSATGSALIAGTHFSGDQRSRSQADAIAAQDQERLKGLSDQQLAGFNQTRTVTFPTGTSFTVQSVATFLDTTGGSSCASTGVAYYRVISTVSWTENYSTRPANFKQESILARPVSGDLLTQVNDERLQSLQGVTVTAAGPSTQSATTDANGCVAFAGLTPGSYTLTLADPNYVDPNGNSSPPNATATVTTTGATTVSSFHLGLAGSIAGSFTTATTGAGGEADTISWLARNGASLGMTAFKSSPSQPLSAPVPLISTGRLFPFDVLPTLPASYSSNYAVWAGKCLQMEPPSGVDQFTVAPGSTNQAQNVQEPLLDVNTVNYTNGGTTAPVKPAHVKLTFTSTAGNACTSSWYSTVTSSAAEPTTGWLANPGQPFATTQATGPTASAASASGPPQTGTLTICADYYDSAAGTSYNGSLAGVTNTNFSATSPTLWTIPIVKSAASRGTC